jgi:glycosyltransferase involved in cell wall biosynthesis
MRDAQPEGSSRLRILFAIHDFLPRHQAGSEIYAFELCRELAARHHVTVMCADYDPAAAHGHVRWRAYQDIPVVEIVNNWRCASFVDTYRPPLVGERIRQVLQVVQPDIVHVHNLLNLSFDLPQIAHRAGIPVVVTLHDYTLVCPSGGQRLHRAEQHVCHVIDTDRCARCFPQSPFASQMSFERIAAGVRAPRLMRQAASRVLKRLPGLSGRLASAAARAPRNGPSVSAIDSRLEAARQLFDTVDLFIAPSPSIASEFQKLGMKADRIRVSDYGFVPLVGSARSRGPLLRIGFAGTLVWHKGVHVLIEAVRNLPADRFELKIFGNPDVFPEYTRQLRNQAAGLPIRFMGAFARERIAEVYSAIDVLVVPSLWLENSPLVIHEAFMAGVPVVGARMGGIVDLIDEGRTGMLYDASSPSDLARALRELIEDPGQLETMAAHVAAAPPIKSISQNARECESIYYEMIRRAAAGAAT